MCNRLPTLVIQEEGLAGRAIAVGGVSPHRHPQAGTRPAAPKRHPEGTRPIGAGRGG
jgi:hypothetical protein